MKQTNNNGTRFVTACGIAVIIYLFVCMMLALAGCSSLKKTFTKSSTDSTSVQVSKSDSSGTKNTKETYTKETNTFYRDTVVFLEGKPYPVYMPTQTIIREVGQKNTEEAASKKEDEKGTIEVKKQDEQKQVDKTKIPFYIIIMFAVLALVIIGIASLFFYIKKIRP